MMRIKKRKRRKEKDLNDFDLSKSTAWTTRNATRKEEYEKFYSNFKPPKHSVVGWDGKVVKLLT